MSTTKEAAADCMHMIQKNVTLIHDLLTTAFEGSESSSHKTQKSIDQLKDHPFHLEVKIGHPDSLPTIDSIIAAVDEQLPDEPCHPHLSAARTVLNYIQSNLCEEIEGRCGVREDDIEKAFSQAVDTIACIYAALHKILHPGEGFKRPRTPTKDHRDITWEGLGSIEIKTYGDNAFDNLIEDCTQNPNFHLWPQIRDFVYGEPEGHAHAGDTAEQLGDGWRPRSKSWKMLAQFIGYSLQNRTGIVVATNFLHHWVVLRIPIGLNKDELHKIPITLMLLFYNQVLLQNTTSISPGYNLFDPLPVASTALEATSVVAGKSSGPLYWYHSLCFETEVDYPLNPPRVSLMMTILEPALYPPQYASLSLLTGPVAKVFIHVDDLMQEVKAYQTLESLFAR
ncbi:hypothetical protein BKA70DRAFT_1225447 [Coprinopsis sp. MPI-PUGE-AT-0042]|nr:hypothetical protein BKA70DRAFT_1225447 [Coprinopsis sp. MPI-PUGE-AT-0042]